MIPMWIERKRSREPQTGMLLKLLLTAAATVMTAELDNIQELKSSTVLHS